MAAIKYPNSKYFKKELDNKKLDKIYLFMGEEEGEKDKFINKILGLVFQNDTDRANSTGRFHIENKDEFLSAADFAVSQSMFSSNRVCIMRNIDTLKQVKSNTLIFNDTITDLPESTVLIMTTIKNNPPGFISSDFLKKIKVVQFWRYFENDTFNYINMALKKYNIQIDSRGTAMLVKLTGRDIKKIDEAIEMLRHAGVSGIITQDVIKNLIYDVKNVTIFEFIDLLFHKKNEALKLIKKIIEDGNPELLILNMIVRQAEIIENYHIHLKNSIPADDALKKCGVYSRNRDSFLQQIRLFPFEKIKRLFPLISKADFQIKSRRGSKAMIANPIFNLVTDILFCI